MWNGRVFSNCQSCHHGQNSIHSNAITVVPVLMNFVGDIGITSYVLEESGGWRSDKVVLSTWRSRANLLFLADHGMEGKPYNDHRVFTDLPSASEYVDRCILHNVFDDLTARYNRAIKAAGYFS